MSIVKRSKRLRIRALWPGSGPPSSTTDDIPPLVDPRDIDHPRLTRHATEPTLAEPRLSPLTVGSASSNILVHVTMSNSATITFSQAGVQPPLYVVTSLSDPPWETLEMDVDQEPNAAVDPLFVRHFDNVPEGDYQYKIRVGNGHWVVDESKDSATDQHGNRNNVIHVKPAKDAQSRGSTSDTAAEKDQGATRSQQTKDTEPHDCEHRSMDSSGDLQLPSVPIPFVVVEKVADKEQPGYGDTESHPLASDTAKRTADFQPDFETSYEDTSASSEPPKSPEVPLLVVEKTDDRLEHGDDFGDNATAGQKLAHDKRAADASPDRLVLTPEGYAERDIENEQAAPLFHHESAQVGETPLPPALDTIDEVSVQSSANQTSSEDNINTPGESQDEDASSPESPLLNNVDPVQSYTELGSGPFLSHEASLEEEEQMGGELTNGPLLSHETGLNGNTAYSDTDEDGDELDAAPLLPHETGFKDDVSERRHYSYHDDDEDYGDNAIKPDDVSTYTHQAFDGYDNDYGDDDAPLLPHERDLVIQDDGSPEESSRFSLHRHATSEYETEDARDLFGGSAHPNIFMTRTNSSTLPHKLPQSDVDDENLNDPSLERFPTNRDQILQRVATIGLQLPEDQTMEEDIHSPDVSVMSQACSSVDLAPVKSYASLASVPEAEDSDEEEMDDGDVESLPSPMLMNFARNATDFARDPYATPLPNESKRIELTEDNNPQKPASQTTRSSEADSVCKNDGTKDFKLSNLREAIATPTKVFNTITSPRTPEKQDVATSHGSDVLVSESELRARNIPKQNAPENSHAPSATFESQAANDSTVKASVQQLGQPNKSFLQSFFHVVFGSMGRFLTACIGDRKRAGATVVIGGAVAYYLFA